MGYEELAATFLSNLLAAPYNTQQAQLSAQQQQALLAQALGGDDAATAQAQQLVPNVSAFPGMDVPVLGSVLNGVGQVGHVLQVGLGNAPDAPRPPLDAYVKLSESARKKKAQDDYAAAIASGASPSERAAKLASLGEFSAAEKALNPNAGKPSPYGDLGQFISDPKQRYEQWRQDQIDIASGKASATAGVADQERVKGAGRASTLLGIPGADSEYGGLVQQQAAELGVDPQFALAIMGAESSGNPAARSPKGAVGLMQVMPGTAQPYLRPGERLDDPQVNARVGVAHLKDLLDYYGGDKQLAAAAYNAGQAAVDAAKGIPNFPETQQYVQRVSRYYMGANGQASGAPAPAGRTATLNDGQAVVTGGKIATGPGSTVAVENPQAKGAVAQAETAGRLEAQQNPAVLEVEKQHAAEMARATEMAKTLPEGERDAFVALDTNLSLLKRLQTEFRPEQIQQYVGWLRLPASQLVQKFAYDPTFAKFQALLGQIQVAKFDAGGKNLTKTESDILDRFTPTGLEGGGVRELFVKVDEGIKALEAKKADRLRYATTPVGELGTTTTTTTPGTTTTTVPRVLRIEKVSP